MGDHVWLITSRHTLPELYFIEEQVKVKWGRKGYQFFKEEKKLTLRQYLDGKSCFRSLCLDF